MSKHGKTAVYQPSLGDAQVRVSWAGVPDASYLVELGSSPGNTDLGVYQVVGANHHTVDGLTPGAVHARVRAQTDGGISPPSSEARVVVFDLRDYIEALFLGTGRANAEGGGCPEDPGGPPGGSSPLTNCGASVIGPMINGRSPTN